MKYVLFFSLQFNLIYREQGWRGILVLDISAVLKFWELLINLLPIKLHGEARFKSKSFREISEAQFNLDGEFPSLYTGWLIFSKTLKCRVSFHRILQIGRVTIDRTR